MLTFIIPQAMARALISIIVGVVLIASTVQAQNCYPEEVAAGDRVTVLVRNRVESASLSL